MMVALTGIERANFQFSSVQLGLSECKYVQLVRREAPKTSHGRPTLSLGCHSRAKFIDFRQAPSLRPSFSTRRTMLSMRTTVASPRTRAAARSHLRGNYADKWIRKHC